MSIFFVPVLQLFACLGLGAMLLRAFKVLSAIDKLDQFIWAFVIGFGLLGWLLFFIGFFDGFIPTVLWLFLALSTLGIFLLGNPLRGLRFPSGRLFYLLLMLSVPVLLIDISEAMAPPADADTLAYHYAIAKRFWLLGGLQFIPRAVDGAVPLLVHMSYVPVYGLGGETSLNIWSMITGWIPALVLYSISRKFISEEAAALAGLLLLSVPAVIISGGTGQVEIRNAMFVMIAAASISLFFHKREIKYVLVAGTCVGFFVAAKYLGLLFALSSSVTLLFGRNRCMALSFFCLAILVAGFQWYLWNWWNSGDPIFPFLIGHFGIGNPEYWSQNFHTWFKKFFFGSELIVDRTFFWFLFYPFFAVFGWLGDFNNIRTGFGPYVPLILPWCVAAVWRYPDKIGSSPLTPVAIMLIIFYTLWFFIGSSQRLRHLLPVLPLIILLTLVASSKVTMDFANGRLLLGSILFVVMIQMGGQILYGSNYVRYHLTNESRDQFLTRNVPQYGLAKWINQKLSHDEKVLIRTRQLAYLIDRQYFLAHPFHQKLVDFREGRLSIASFLKQLNNLSITKVATFQGGQLNEPDDYISKFFINLMRTDCANALHQFDIRGFASRTLRARPDSVDTGIIMDIGGYHCE